MISAYEMSLKQKENDLLDGVQDLRPKELVPPEPKSRFEATSDLTRKRGTKPRTHLGAQRLQQRSLGKGIKPVLCTDVKNSRHFGSGSKKASQEEDHSNVSNHPVNYPILKYAPFPQIPNTYKHQHIDERNIQKSQYNTCIPVDPTTKSQTILPAFVIDILDPAAKVLDSSNKTARGRFSGREFVTVYEYKVGNYSIIWDYVTGWVYITSVWKCLGHTKADVMRLINYSPEICNKVYKTKGGCLKVQGTWLQYDVVKTLASRFCYPIRYSLVPIFGMDFIELCLEPKTIGYGLFQLIVPNKKSTVKRRKSSVDKEKQKLCENGHTESDHNIQIGSSLKNDYAAKVQMRDIVLSQSCDNSPGLLEEQECFVDTFGSMRNSTQDNCERSLQTSADLVALKRRSSTNSPYSLDNDSSTYQSEILLRSQIKYVPSQSGISATIFGIQNRDSTDNSIFIPYNYSNYSYQRSQTNYTNIRQSIEVVQNDENTTGHYLTPRSSDAAVESRTRKACTTKREIRQEQLDDNHPLSLLLQVVDRELSLHEKDIIR